MTHKEKMEARRAKYHEMAACFVRPLEARANVGRKHPDYGLHPIEHAKRKAAKAAKGA